MNRSSTILAIFLLSSSVTPSANAQDRTGFAINAEVGSSFINDTDGNDEFRGTSFGGIFGVEYRFIPQFALGVNFFTLGTADDDFDGTNTEIQVKGFDLVGRLILPVSEKAELFGLIGGASYFADLEPGGSNGFDGDSAWEFGAGLDYDTTPDFSIRLVGRYIRGPRDENGGLITVGMSYRF